MPPPAVQLDLDPEAAELFRKASADMRERITVLCSAIITAQTKRPQNLSKVMDELSDRAVARGLTQERLNDLLDKA